jgi:S1-C subfamily serine protease
VTGLDWIIVAVVTLLAFFGYAQGFVVGALTLAGFAGGAFGGSRLAPQLLEEGAQSPYAPLFALLGAVLGGALLAFGLQLVAEGLRGAIPAVPGLGVVDGLLGAVLSAALGLGLAWLFGAVALQTPGARELRGDIQRSAILTRLNAILPPSGPVLNALARFDPVPEIRGPDADVAPPRAAIARDPDVRAAGASVVRLRGTACGLGVEGSGWVAGDGVVVTNAHVVAGQDDTVVQVGGEAPDLEARPVLVDARNDLAVLRVPGLQAPALPLAGEPESGTAGAILGYPLNGPYDVRAARLGPTSTVLAQDAYGRGPVRRSLTAFRGLVRSGNSGGPVVDGDGRVVATVFAARTGAGPRGGYGVPNGIVRRALEGAGQGEVDTGPCTA